MPQHAAQSFEWCRALRAFFQNKWPSDYILIDTETCGVQPLEDYALQVGCVIVRDRQIVHKSSVYLDWVGAGLVGEQWLRNRMADVALQMASSGSVYRLDFDTVRQQGQDPRIIIPAMAGVLRDGLTNGLAIVGHNIAAFDLILISRHILDITQDRLLIPAAAVFDTGMLEKARQLNAVPDGYEDQVQWFRRVYGQRARVKWKLDRWCADQYGLWERSGLDPTAAHDALSDCVLCHHLFEAFRELVLEHQVNA